MIKSIVHDQPQKNFKYLWLDFRLMEKYVSDTFRIRFLDFRFGNLKSKIENLDI